MTVDSFGMKVIKDIASHELPKEVIGKIPYSFARKNMVIALADKEESITVAISDPLNMNALEELHLMLDKKIDAVLAPEDKILSLINQCYNHEEGATKRLIENLGEKKNGDRPKDDETIDLLEIKEEAPIIRLLNLVIGEAIEQRASDIHFEPQEDDLKIRYRIDGMLQARHAAIADYKAELLSRIKVLAKLDIAEHRLPQDGRIKLKMGGREIDLRVSTIPVAGGERIVLRILDQAKVNLGLDQIGMLGPTLKVFRELISLPEGIVLVTGPTGSGKTTTLYSALCERVSEDINIMTIEDPVEYKLKGIAQIAVQPKIGLSFAAGLRHILRQDPDLVMVGEIRDTETAEIAIQASLTGHLVLSTLHTNDAPSTITRLTDMGIEPYLLSSTVVGILAQRLLRKICPHCKEGYRPSDEELQELDVTRDDLNNHLIFRGRGCSSCFGSGYQGRHGIYELLKVDDNLSSEIAKNCDAGELRRHALKSGLITLRKHGAELVRLGITTPQEVLRVTRRI